MTLESKFSIGDRVFIDGDRSVFGFITLIEWRGAGMIRYEVSWLHNGDVKFIFFDEWRLNKDG